MVGLKGAPVYIKRGIDTNVIVSEARSSSRKPDELYGIAERLVGERPKLELFARTTRAGWYSIGDQLTPSSVTAKIWSLS